MWRHLFRKHCIFSFACFFFIYLTICRHFLALFIQNLQSELDRAGLQSEEALYEEIERCQSLESTLEEQLAANEANEAREATKATETTVATSGLANDERFMAGISQLLGSDNRLKPSSMLTGRLKRAADLLISLALPAAVQAQMIAGPAPGDTKLSEVKLSQVTKMVLFIFCFFPIIQC